MRALASAFVLLASGTAVALTQNQVSEYAIDAEARKEPGCDDMVTGVTTFNIPVHATSTEGTTLRIVAVGERGDKFPACVVFLAVNDRGKARWFEAADIVLTQASIFALRKYAA